MKDVRIRSIVSILLICHLAALAVSAVPDPTELRLAAGIQVPESVNMAPEPTDDALSSRVRPALDTAANVLGSLSSWAWKLSAVLHPLANRYVERLGLVQGWRMFANPPRGAEYLRFRYYSTADPIGDAKMTVATEIVFPAAPDTKSHVVRAFWLAHRDKAISNALVAYFRRRIERKEAGLSTRMDSDPEREAGLTRNFVPVVKYFSAEYARTHLRAGERLVRTEAWYGWAPSRARHDSPISPRARFAAIARYYGGPSDQSISHPIFQPIDTIEREADVSWMLISIRTP